MLKLSLRALRSLLVLYSVFFATHLLANNAHLTFSNSSAEFGFNTGGDYTDTVDFGFTGYYNDEQDIFISADMLTALEGDSSSQWLFSLGANGFGTLLKRKPKKNEKKTEDEAYIGAAATLRGGYKFLTAIPIATIIDVSYSPNILNTGNVKSMRKFAGYVEFMFSPSAIGRIGYRNYSTDFASDTLHLGEARKTFEDTAVIGIKLRF